MMIPTRAAGRTLVSEIGMTNLVQMEFIGRMQGLGMYPVEGDGYLHQLGRMVWSRLLVAARAPSAAVT